MSTERSKVTDEMFCPSAVFHANVKAQLVSDCWKSDIWHQPAIGASTQQSVMTWPTAGQIGNKYVNLAEKNTKGINLRGLFKQTSYLVDVLLF